MHARHDGVGAELHTALYAKHGAEEGLRTLIGRVHLAVVEEALVVYFKHEVKLLLLFLFLLSHGADAAER